MGEPSGSDVDSGPWRSQYSRCKDPQGNPYTLSFPTVSDLLRLPELRSGHPDVAGGSSGLSNPVRWVHASELADIARLLSGGELILTMGLGLDVGPEALRDYAVSLSEAGVSGLVIEAGRRFDEVPAALIQTAEELGLPVILLRREVRFVNVTQEAHAVIIGSQTAELRVRDKVHQAFTEMAVEGASVAEVVRYTFVMAQRPVLFADRAGHVVAFESGVVPAADLIASWHEVAQGLPDSPGTEFVVGTHAWLVRPVSARGETWGRLALMETAGQTTDHVRVILERAALGLVLNRLVERDRETLEFQAHRSLVRDVLVGTFGTSALTTRAQALGFATEGRRLVAGYIAARDPEFARGELDAEKRLRDLGQLVTQASSAARVRTLVGPLPSRMVGLIASFSASDDIAIRLGRLAEHVHSTVADHGGSEVIVAFGSQVNSLPEARWSFQEAEQVIGAVRQLPAKANYQVADVGLQGLVYLLRDDERLQRFRDRELGPLMAFDARHGSDLLRVLRTFLGQGGNKAGTATELGLSRPTLYARLAQIAAILKVDLDLAESRLSLHVASLALDATQLESMFPRAWGPSARVVP